MAMRGEIQPMGPLPPDPREGILGKTYKEGEYWIAEALQLPLAGVGKTPELAFRSFMSCFSSYMEAAGKLGIWDLVLREHGVKFGSVERGAKELIWSAPLVDDPRREGQGLASV